jgi:hypothetical protein
MVAEDYPFVTRKSFKNLRVSLLLRDPLLSISYFYQILLTTSTTSFNGTDKMSSFFMNFLTKLVISYLDKTLSLLTSYSAKNLLN